MLHLLHYLLTLWEFESEVSEYKINKWNTRNFNLSVDQDLIIIIIIIPINVVLRSLQLSGSKQFSFTLLDYSGWPKN